MDEQKLMSQTERKTRLIATLHKLKTGPRKRSLHGVEGHIDGVRERGRPTDDIEGWSVW